MVRLLGYEKVRFAIAGLLNTGLDFILLNALVFLLSTYPLVANIFSVSVGITISYLLNHRFVFRYEEKPTFKKYLIFFAVTGFSSLIIQSIILFLFSVFFNSSFGHSLFVFHNATGQEFVELNIAKATAVLVGMIWNFTIYKHVVFKNKSIPADVKRDIIEEITE